MTRSSGAGAARLSRSSATLAPFGEVRRYRAAKRNDPRAWPRGRSAKGGR